MDDRYFPLFISLKGKKILVVGGGRIAQGRIETLLRFQADITVISPEFTQKISEWGEQGSILLREKYYQEDDLGHFYMVLATTNDPQVNVQVVKQCRSRGILVNDASDQKQCDFFFPAIIEEDGLVFGVTSGGRNHRKVKEVCAAVREFLFARREQEMT